MEEQTGISIRIARVQSGKEPLPLPSYATPGASGMDLCADDEGTVQPGETKLIPTGFVFEIPEGFEAQVRPRSGLAIKNGIGILNSPGTIDSDYRGEVKIILSNFGKTEFAYRRGDRIAQMVICPVVRAVLKEVPELGGTHRGSGGFGHTGTSGKPG